MAGAAEWEAVAAAAVGTAQIGCDLERRHMAARGRGGPPRLLRMATGMIGPWEWKGLELGTWLVQ